MNNHTQREAAARLLRAIEAPDPLAATHANAFLQELVEAEHSGLDIDNDARFMDVLQHLEHCERCAESYARLSEEMAAFVRDSEVPRTATPVQAPVFFGAPRNREGVIVRVLNGLKRRFELVLPGIPMAPARASLGAEGELALFSGTINDLPGSPRISVSLTGEYVALDVVVRDTPRRRWQVQLVLADRTETIITNERGVARFTGLSAESLRGFTVRCTELSS